MPVTPIFSTDMSFGGCSILTVAEPEDEINENKPISVFSIAKKYGLKDVFIADKTLSGLVESYNICEKNNLNLRIGYKTICCQNIDDKSEKSFASEHKIIIWLNHGDGYKNFVKLISKIQTEGFYYIPRADYNLLREFWNEHLSISIPFYDSFLHKNYLEFGQCLPEFPIKPTLFLESNNLPFDEILRQKVLDYAKHENCEALETKSVYYFAESDYKAYLTNKAINNRSNLEKPEFRHNCSNQFSFESARNLGLDIFNSSKFAQSFSKLDLPFYGIRLPHIKVEDRIKQKIGISTSSDNYQLLKSLCKEGFHRLRKLNYIKEEDIEWYRNQCTHELKTLKTLGFVDYVLIVWDMVNFCVENDIPVGRGRGSAAGSSVLYLLGITDIPVKRHGLLFERFLSADRAATIEKNGITYLTDAPDVDQDISRAQRYKVVDYLNKKYPGQTSKIINISTLQGKVLIKEVAKCVDNCEQSELNLITDLIPVEFGNVADIERVYGEVPEFKEWCDKHPETYKISLKLRGLAKNKSIHASGYLITHCNIDEFIPTELTADKQLVSSFDMYSAGTIAIKLDLLGLKTLDILDGAGKLVGKKFNNTDIDDPSIYKYLSNPAAPFMGIFQAEEGLGEKTLRRIEPNNINHIIDSIAIGRPGAMRYTNDYCDFKKGIKFPNIHEKVLDILEPTGGLLLYQETLMALSVRMANFTPNESNGIRKAVGKKDKKKMLSYKERFLDGSIKNGFSKEYSEDIWNTFEMSADYSFNRCIWEEEFVNERVAGFVKLKTLKVGDEILAFDIENNRNHWVKIKKIYKNQKNIFYSSVGGVDIATSKDHKFFTRNGMKRVEDCILENNEVKTIEGWEKITPMYSQVVKPNHIDWIFNTIDLEVDHKDHNFYCNGICVSNSHSASYGYLTAITAYFKANHPKEFFLSLLKNAQNESEPLVEVNKIQKELKWFGIELLPPCLLKGNIDFCIENDNIRFGLNSIKGLAESALNKLQSFKPENCNKFEMFQAAKQAGLSCGVMASLIMSGALDIFVTETRNKLSFECLLFSRLKDKEKIYCLNQAKLGNTDLISLIKNIIEWTDSLGKKVARKTRLNTLRKDTLKYQEIYKLNSQYESLCNWWFENELLGFAYSSTLKEIFSKSGRADIINLSQFKHEIEPNSSGIIICQLKEFKTSVSKKGNPMMKLFVSDESDNNYFYFAGNSYQEFLVEQENNPKLKEKDIVAIKVMKSKDGSGGFVQKLTVQSQKIYCKLADLKDLPVEESENIITVAPELEQTENSDQFELNLV